MYQQEQKLTNMHQTASLLYKNLIQFVISLCVFCFIVLHPSWLPFIHSSMSHLCTFSSHLVSLATDKKYIFLLCNGILVLIAKYPSQRIDTRLPILPETSPDEDLSFGKYQQSSQFSTEKLFLVQDVATNKEVMMEEDKVVEEKYVVYQITNGEEQEEEVTNDGDDEKYEQEEVEHEKYEQEEEKDGYEEYDQEEDVEEEEEETISKMSTEELNRKFDEFIRKMKEELRIEAQRQLILV